MGVPITFHLYYFITVEFGFGAVTLWLQVLVCMVLSAKAQHFPTFLSFVPNWEGDSDFKVRLRW